MTKVKLTLPAVVAAWLSYPEVALEQDSMPNRGVVLAMIKQCLIVNCKPAKLPSTDKLIEWASTFQQS